MKTKIYTYYDKIAMQCEGLRHARNHADAIRMFNRSFKDRDDMSDFALLHLGEMEHDNGKCEMLDVPEELPVNVEEFETRQFVRENEGDGKDGSVIRDG